MGVPEPHVTSLEMRKSCSAISQFMRKCQSFKNGSKQPVIWGDKGIIMNISSAFLGGTKPYKNHSNVLWWSQYSIHWPDVHGRLAVKVPSRSVQWVFNINMRDYIPFNYNILTSTVDHVAAEKDHGVIFDSHLSFYLYSNEKINKASISHYF